MLGLRPADDVIDAVFPRSHPLWNGVPSAASKNSSVDFPGILGRNRHPLEVGPFGGELPWQPVIQSDAAILIDSCNKFQARVLHRSRDHLGVDHVVGSRCVTWFLRISRDGCVLSNCPATVTYQPECNASQFPPNKVPICQRRC